MATSPKDDFDFLRVEQDLFGPSTPEQARRLGFGRDEPAQLARIVSFDAGYDTALSDCEAKPWAAAGKDARTMVAGYLDLANVIMDDFRTAYEKQATPRFQPLRVKFADCLAAAGYRPVDREKFISAPDPRALGVTFGALEGVEDTWEPNSRVGGVQVGPAIPPRRYVPTPAETDLAVAWQRCTVEAGSWIHCCR